MRWCRVLRERGLSLQRNIVVSQNLPRHIRRLDSNEYTCEDNPMLSGAINPRILTYVQKVCHSQMKSPCLCEVCKLAALMGLLRDSCPLEDARANFSLQKSNPFMSLLYHLFAELLQFDREVCNRPLNGSFLWSSLVICNLKLVWSHLTPGLPLSVMQTNNSLEHRGSKDTALPSWQHATNGRMNSDSTWKIRRRRPKVPGSPFHVSKKLT